MRITSLLVLSVILIACHKKNKAEQREENNPTMQKELMYSPKNYNERPYYTVQLGKGGCGVELLVNDFPVWNYYEKGGLSVNLPINTMIAKSGEHTITLKVYPDQDKETLDGYSYVTLDIRLFKDVADPAGEYTSALKYELPKEAKENNLPYFEIDIPFKAQVPYDISNLLDEAQELEGQNGIEKEIAEEYKRAHQAFKELNANWFIEKKKRSSAFFSEAFYENEQEYKKNLNGVQDYLIPGAEVLPLGDYEIKYYCNGKVVMLFTKGDKEMVLKSILNKGTKDEEVITYGLGLYKLKGSDEFLAL